MLLTLNWHTLVCLFEYFTVLNMFESLFSRKLKIKLEFCLTGMLHCDIVMFCELCTFCWVLNFNFEDFSFGRA